MFDMLRKFDMHNCESIQTPMETNVTLGASDGNVIANIKICQQMVRKMSFLTIIRPNITFLVRAISRYM